ncbi:hypothetical protein QTP70_019881 [Hemibagrus guttatus]|uniref:Carrier domain-containing protein n=1 Tax=Hemibagrus guttatus TaxID=175788 RepID=A0AAE0Q9X1_9TELE|nr:hypothetical protein QTP70_019881 [Hemibagrus guttatus]
MNRVIMKSLDAMVHEAAVNHGSKTAAVFDTGASLAVCLTYAELVALGNELCRNLQGTVGKNEQFIGVFCEVNIFLPVWIIGSLFQMTPDDIVFLASPLTFDPSVVEMFLALASGACLLMVPSAVRRMPARLANVLFRRNATTVLQYWISAVVFFVFFFVFIFFFIFLFFVFYFFVFVVFYFIDFVFFFVFIFSVFFFIFFFVLFFYFVVFFVFFFYFVVFIFFFVFFFIFFFVFFFSFFFVFFFYFFVFFDFFYFIVFFVIFSVFFFIFFFVFFFYFVVVFIFFFVFFFVFFVSFFVFFFYFSVIFFFFDFFYFVVFFFVLFYFTLFFIFFFYVFVFFFFFYFLVFFFYFIVFYFIVFFVFFFVFYFDATPTLMRRFGGRVLQEEILSAGSSLRVLALGGEVCPSLFLLNTWRGAGNKTHIYNLYGTTEVSCWACYYKLPGDLTVSSDHMDSGSVPLGKALMDTAVEVRDENGCLVTEGEGQVFIGAYSSAYLNCIVGGQERVCLLDDERMTPAKGVMRATGDWVMVQNSHLYYLGRKDRLVKRHGQMLHLDALQQAMENLPQVEVGVVGLHKSSRLVAFVVPKIYTRTVSSEHSSNQEQRMHTFTKGTENSSRVSSRAVEMEVLKELSQVVPSHSVPDTLLLIPALPLTNHGKVAMEKLMRMYERQREVNGKHTRTGDVETVRERLQALWKECLGLCDDGVVTDDAHFMLSGGDSLQALRLFDYITVTMETSPAGLLEVILDGSFSDVLKHITATHPNPNKTSGKRLPEDSASVVSSKRRYHTEADTNFDPERILPPVGSSESGKKRFVVVRRAGDVVFWDYFAKLVTNSKGESGNMDRIREECPSAELRPLSISRTSLTATNSSSVRPTDMDVPAGNGQNSGVTSQADITKDIQPLGLQLCWSSDTGRCVDASPVLLVGPERNTVFIGSHSHRLQALDLSSGEVMWERVLGDRLESSAAVSKCGTLVALGCYDGQVYFLSVDSGETHWVFKTGDAVKSSPAVDPQTGLVIVGSHDGHVYALEPLVKQCAWKHYCGGGAVFSSPCVHSSPRRLYSATLRGQLHCLSPDSGTVLWTYSTDVPFFSSPSCSDSCVCVGAVNGHITALSHDGIVLWDFLTDGPVFSSPCLTSPPPLTRSGARDGCTKLAPSCPAVFCGSHDSSIYCIDSNGSLLWRFQTTGKVYSSPFVFNGSPWGVRTLVAVASTDGTLWVLDGEQGTVKASFLLPGELFSSPVVWGHAIVVGCRNDYVYCLQLTNRTE